MTASAGLHLPELTSPSRPRRKDGRWLLLCAKRSARRVVARDVLELVSNRTDRTGTPVATRHRAPLIVLACWGGRLKVSRSYFRPRD